MSIRPAPGFGRRRPGETDEPGETLAQLERVKAESLSPVGFLGSALQAA
jgi:hypothetical protein